LPPGTSNDLHKNLPCLEQNGALRIGAFECSSLRHPVEAKHEDPVSIHAMLAGFSVRATAGSTPHQLPPGREREEVRLPISALLTRIRKLIPRQNNDHYEEIVHGFGIGALRPPTTPMSDGELARAIAEFLKDAPSAASVSSLGRRLDPSSRV
jgi:hypothetical protein